MTQNVSTKYKQSEHDARKADIHIKYCVKCSRCWEVIVGSAKSDGTKRRYVQYYDNFVTYGKEKEKCHMCKRREKNE